MNTEHIRAFLTGQASRQHAGGWVRAPIRVNDIIRGGPGGEAVLVDSFEPVRRALGTSGGISRSANRDLFDLSAHSEARLIRYYAANATPSGSVRVVPLSKLLADRVGACLQMSIVTQIAAQDRGMESYLVVGLRETNSWDANHVWNILYLKDAFWLLDTTNDLLVRLTGLQPYQGQIIAETDPPSRRRYFFT